MATFNFTPSFSTSLSIEPNTRVFKFGDGYEHRLHVGINVAPRKWNLVFNKRTNTERTNILNFLKNDGGNGKDNFDWTDPHGDAGKWVCRSWTVGSSVHNYNDLSMTFEEVFEA